MHIIMEYPVEYPHGTNKMVDTNNYKHHQTQNTPKNSSERVNEIFSKPEQNH